MKFDRPRTGRSLVFTDLHVGISSDRESRQRIAEDVVHELADCIDREGISQVFFLGDLFHHRTSIEVTSLNVANDLVRLLASKAEVFLLQGNHDLYEKYNSIVTSLNIFDLDNVNVVSTPAELTLNGQRVLLVPWLCGQSLQSHIDREGLSQRYSVMMGHFDLGWSGDIPDKGQRFVQAWKDGDRNLSSVEEGNIVSEILHHTDDFSTIYLGHIHEHETISFANRVWHIVGSPQFQTHDMKRLPDSRKHHGYYVLDEGNRETFHDCVSIPRFVTLYASDVAKGTVDQSKLEGAVVRRCYDVVLTDEQKSQMDELVVQAKVYEEDSSVFVLDAANQTDGESDPAVPDFDQFVDKFDFIQSQVNRISHPAVDNQRLLALLRDYYQKS